MSQYKIVVNRKKSTIAFLLGFVLSFYFVMLHNPNLAVKGISYFGIIVFIILLVYNFLESLTIVKEEK